jgi:hypothetical protein
MKPPPDKLLPLVTTAAELKAAGASWAAVALRVGRSPDTVRRWPALYADAWRRLVGDAERQLLADVGAESVTTLRQMLRSEDEKIRRDAARTLLALRDKAKAGAGDDAAGAGGKWSPIVAYLERLTDDQITTLTDELTAAVRGGPDGPAAEPGGGGGPA